MKESSKAKKFEHLKKKRAKMIMKLWMLGSKKRRRRKKQFTISRSGTFALKSKEQSS